MTAPVIAARYTLYKGVMITAKIVMLKDVPLERAAAEDGVIGRYNHFDRGIFAYSQKVSDADFWSISSQRAGDGLREPRGVGLLIFFRYSGNIEKVLFAGPRACPGQPFVSQSEPYSVTDTSKSGHNSVSAYG